MCFGPDVDGLPLLIASGSDDCTVRLWDADTSDPVGKPLRGHTFSVQCVAFGPSREGRPPLLASGDRAGVVRLWSAFSDHCWQPVGDPLMSDAIANMRSISALCFSPLYPGQPLLLASASMSGSIHFWQVDDQLIPGQVHRAAFSVSSNRVTLSGVVGAAPHVLRLLTHHASNCSTVCAYAVTTLM